MCLSHLSSTILCSTRSCAGSWCLLRSWRKLSVGGSPPTETEDIHWRNGISSIQILTGTWFTTTRLLLLSGVKIWSLKNMRYFLIIEEDQSNKTKKTMAATIPFSKGILGRNRKASWVCCQLHRSRWMEKIQRIRLQKSRRSEERPFKLWPKNCEPVRSSRPLLKLRQKVRARHELHCLQIQ